MNTLLSKSSLSLATALFLLTGCGETNLSQTPTQVQEVTNLQTLSTYAKAKVNRNIINEGESIEFTLINHDDIIAYEWRDTNGKLLSIDKKFNKLFQNEGVYKITLTITDKNENVTTETFTIKVNKITNTIIANLPDPTLHIMDKEFIHLRADNNDTNNSLSYEWRDMDGILLSTTNTLDRKLYYFPQYDFNNDGTTRFVKTLFTTNNNGETTSKDFEIIVHKILAGNQYPIVSAGLDITTTLGTDVLLSANASDFDGTIESYQWKEGATIVAETASFTTSDLAPGTHIFTITVTDDKGAKTSDEVVVLVEEDTTTTQNVTMKENTSKEITLNGSNANDDTTTYDIVTNPTNGTLTGTAPNLIYTPNENYFGVDSFTFKINDDIVRVNLTIVAYRITQNIVKNNDGTIAYTRTYTYDAKGNILTNNFNIGGNDTSNTKRNTYTYDANGNILILSVDGSYDENADGTADRIFIYTYDLNSNRLTEKYDNNADGIVDSIYAYTYDRNDNILTSNYDSDNDGIANIMSSFTYDANGNILTYSIDEGIYDNGYSNTDGIIDKVYTYTYDANNNMLTETYDRDADGIIDTISTYTYDENNNKLTTNTANKISTYSYTYDADGNILKTTYDRNTDGIIDSIQTYTYDENGNILTASTDWNADSTADSISNYTWIRI